MWKKVDELYQSKDLPNRAYVRERFFTFKMDDNKSLIENLGEFKQISKNWETRLVMKMNHSFYSTHFQKHIKKSKWLLDMEGKKSPQVVSFQQ